MLKKRLGIEGIERDWYSNGNLTNHFKISPTLTILEGCEKVGSDTFRWCSVLKKVVIPKSVGLIGSWAFCGCKKLEKVNIPEGVEVIGNYAFENCKRLEKITIPKSVNIIRCGVFIGCKNANIILEKPESEFKHIGNYAFCDCKSVEYAEEETRS